jgi:deoxyribonuclease-4
VRPLGAHLSIAGGLPTAVERAAALGATALQIFTRNQVQWRMPPLDPAVCAEFRRSVTAAGISVVCVHTSYLLNLAADDADLRRRSADALVAEIRRAEAIGCAAVVLHPGASGSATPAQGIARLAVGLSRVLADTADCGTVLALENTSGRGTILGATLAQIAEIVDRCDRHPRLGLCLDTCHAFAAGYDLRTPHCVARLVTEIDRAVGIDRLCLLHLNDSVGPLGSRVDRHAHIGHGAIGDAGFRAVLRNPALAGVPGIIETPKSTPDPLAADRLNLARLRRLEGPPPARRRAVRSG